MRTIVVQNQMKIQPARRLAVDQTQKLQELLVPVTRITGPDHRPFQDVQRREQRGCPMAFVVMGHRPTAASLHRQAGLSPVQSLDLRLLIHAQGQGFLGGIQVKPDDVGQLFHEPLVLRHFERLDPVRLQTMRLPDSGDRHVAHAHLFGQRSRAPMRRGRRPRMQRSLDDKVHRLVLRLSRTLSMRSIFPDSRRPLFLKAVSPKNDRRPGGVQALGDRIVRNAVGGQKANARPKDNPLRRSARLNPGLQGPSLFWCHMQWLGWVPHT